MVGEELNYSNKPPWTRARMHDNPYSSYNNHQSYNNNNNSYVYYPQHSYPQQFYQPPIFYSVPFYQDPQQYYYNNNYHPVSNVQHENKTNYNNTTRRQHTTYYKNPYTNNTKQIQPNVNRVPFQPTIYEPITSPYTNSTQLPRIIFQGEVIIVNSFDKVKPALDALFKDGTAAAHGVGFDMEWKPNFGKSPRNPTSLIQLSTDKVCVIFKMMHLENKMPLELFEVLASPDIVKIGQSLDCGDNERLAQDFHLMLTNSVDISLLAKSKGFKKTNLKEQTRVLLGKNLSKFLCTSNWADIHLTPAQIRYAATDPYVTFLLYHKLMELPDAPVTAVDPPYDGENEYDNQFHNDNEIENENDSEIESNNNDSCDGHSLSGGLSSLKL